MFKLALISSGEGCNRCVSQLRCQGVNGNIGGFQKMGSHVHAYLVMEFVEGCVKVLLTQALHLPCGKMQFISQSLTGAVRQPAMFHQECFDLFRAILIRLNGH